MALLEQSEADVTYTPIMRIEPIDETQSIENLILILDQFDKAIFISANAAELGLEWVDEYWPMLPVGLELFAVGQQTGQIFSQYGYPVFCPQNQQNTEGLLELEQLQKLDGKAVVIFRGGGGRQTLGETLEQRGAKVSYCELYNRVIESGSLERARQQAKTTGCLIAHSGELLQAMADPENLLVPLVVPSNRVAAMAQDMGYQSIVVADNALPESMYRAVEGYFKTAENV
ncbi:MAG: uroporphyrinogen-III synthase [Pseudomonadales bacterium]